MRLARAQLLIPYVEGRGDWSGADCWGQVELRYRVRHGIALTDRGAIAPGPQGMATGFAGARGRGWIEVETPRDDHLVIMRTLAEGAVLQYGHCGLFVAGRVLHTSRATGAVLDRWERLAHRVTCILRHPELA